VSHSLIAKLVTLFLLNPLWINSALSKNIDKKLLINKLEEILNEKKDDLLKDLFLKESLTQFNKDNKSFRKKYKDMKWSITTIKNYPNELFLDIKIKSKRELGNQTYDLDTNQTVKVEFHKNKIKEYEVIDEESILTSLNSPLIIKKVIPSKVLTGERYEINLIIESPLDKSLIASGMTILNKYEKIKISNKNFGLKPNQTGGLFKYIQAPLEPGYQTISAVITHPKGIYSITKKIKVGL